MIEAWTDEDGNKHGTFTFRPGEEPDPGQRTILSLCDGDGVWSRPYRQAGYRVAHIDRDNPEPCDVREVNRDWFEDHDLCDVWGVIAQVPTLDLVERTLAIVEFLRPAWWVIHSANRRAVARLTKCGWTCCVPQGSREGLWGEFNSRMVVGSGGLPEAFHAANP